MWENGNGCGGGRGERNRRERDLEKEKIGKRKSWTRMWELGGEKGGGWE